ncbi:MAG: hydratase [Proteobacteria bacterium]|nr:hydratase [Pseudomonadota bacterium]
MTAAPLSAATLLRHHDEGTPWARPTGLDLDTAYRRQLEVRALRIARGERPRGFKIGFTNRSIWPRYNVFAPIWGTVYDSTLTLCEGEGEVALGVACEPRLEPEAVFGLRATPARDADLLQLFDAIDWVAPGFEIVQSHLTGWRFVAAADPIADGSLHAHLLVGRRVPVREIAADAEGLERQLAAATVRLARGGAVVEQGQGVNVLDGPLHALLHFARELARCPGAPALQPGDVVTTGTWTDAWPVEAGQTWTGHFDAPLSPLTVRFR